VLTNEYHSDILIVLKMLALHNNEC